MRPRSRPLRSSAAIVLSNVGGSPLSAMAFTSARCACIACRNAGQVVLGLDPVERRQAVRRVPRFEQRIGHGAVPSTKECGTGGTARRIIARRRDAGQGAPRRALDRSTGYTARAGIGRPRARRMCNEPEMGGRRDRRRRARRRVVGERQDHVRRRAHDLHGSLRAGQMGWAPVPGNDGRRRPVPVPRERQQAGSALLGRGVVAAVRKIQPSARSRIAATGHAR